MHHKKGHLTVIGSLNVDYLAAVARLPQAGETTLALGLEVRFGGKGANQAVAAARQGAKVRLVGAVGSDKEADAYLTRLRAEGIDVRWVRRVAKMSTGRAFIAVDRRGENHIVVAAGANGTLKPSHLSSAQFRQTALVLAQLEVPTPTVAAALRVAGKAGVQVMLNAAPLRDDFPWGETALDYLVVNEHEATELFGRSPAASASLWATYVRKRMHRWRVRHLIVTRGARATYWADRVQAGQAAVVRVRPRDTVGAGDAFTGTLAAHLAGGLSLREAIVLANAAGALATQTIGAQESLPTLRATKSRVRKLRP